MNSELNHHPLSGATDIDSAASIIWSFYKKNFVALFTISFIISLISQLLMKSGDIMSIQSATTPDEMIQAFNKIYPTLILMVIVTLVLNLFLAWFIALYPLKGIKSVGESFTGTAKSFLPFIVITIIFAFLGIIAIIVGTFALIVGAFFAMVYLVLIFSLLSPVIVLEDQNIGETMSRVFSLANRRFWPTMGWTTLLILILLVASFLLSAIILIPFTGNFVKAILDPAASSAMVEISANPLFVILSSIAEAVTKPLLLLMGFTIYFSSTESGKNLITDNKETGSGPKVEDLYSGSNDKGE